MSFDAEEWAREFVAHVRINPLIATDEGTMTTWFANALVRGYDEACWRYQDEMSRLRTENDHLTRDLFTQKEFPAREVSAIEGVPTICL